MDPFSALGVAASIIACIQLSQSLLKKLGPSAHKTEDLKLILRTMMQFRKAYETLKEYTELDESEEIRLTTFKQVEEPLRECKDIIDTVIERLKKNTFLKQWITGSAWDHKVQKCMSRLNEVRLLLDMAMQSDQLKVISAVEDYARSIASEVRDLRSDFSEYTRVVSSMHDVVVSTENRMSTLQDIEANRAHDENRRSLLQWLSKTDPTINHQVAKKACMRGTGSWLLQSLEYQRWKINKKSFLWLQGLPGAGKTVLCSTVVEDVKDFCSSDSSHLVAFYYFSFSDSQKQSTANCLRSIIAQFVKQSDNAFHAAKTLYNDTADSEPQLGTLKAMLRAIIAAHGCIFIIADALDECPGDTAAQNERELVCETLGEIISWQLDSLHLMVTSRKITDLESMIDEIPGVVTVLIQNSDVNADTRLYVTSELEKDKKLRSWSPDIRTEIETTLAQGANGMFRWVSCQLEMLKRCITPAQVRRSLKCLPKTLYSTYERMLAEINEEYTDMAITALKWLVIAEEPLTLRELAEAVALGLDPRADFDIDNRLSDHTDILRILGSLIAVDVDSDADSYLDFDTDSDDDPDTDAGTDADAGSDADSDAGSDADSDAGSRKVGLAHFSVREYLISALPKPWSINHFDWADLHYFAANACLNYIQFLASGNFNSASLDFYSRFYWYEHARKHNDHDRSNSAKVNASKASQIKAYTPLQIAMSFGNMEAVYEAIQKGFHYKDPPNLDSALKLAKEKGDAYLLELLTLVLMGEDDGNLMRYLLENSTPIPDIDGRPGWSPFLEVILPSIDDQSTRNLRTKLFDSPDWSPSVIWHTPWLYISAPRILLNITAVIALLASAEALRQLYEVYTTYLYDKTSLITKMLAWAVRSSINPLEKVQHILGRAVLEDVPDRSSWLGHVIDVRGSIEAVIDTKNKEIFESLLLDPFLSQCIEFFYPSGKLSLLQKLVNQRWKHGVRFLVEKGAGPNYNPYHYGRFGSVWWICRTPLDIVLSDYKENVAPEDDNEETDRFIKELLKPFGAVRLIDDSGEESVEEEETDRKRAPDECEDVQMVNGA